MKHTLIWYFHRLSRMSPLELLHRIREQLRHLTDRWLISGWADLPAFGGPISGLPGLDFSHAGDMVLQQAEGAYNDLRTGNLRWLGQSWPSGITPLLPELWTLDPVSGCHWPGGQQRKVSYRKDSGRGDVKFVWEPNRLQILHPLAVLCSRGDEEAQSLALALIDSWMAANAPFGGINWTSGIEAASRVVSVLVLITGAGLPSNPELLQRLRLFIAVHARQLARYPSLHSSSNNHRVAELAALLLVLLCAKGLKLRGISTAKVMRQLESEVLRQFHPDGVNAEQSLTYGARSLEWFVVAAIAAESHGIPVSDVCRERMQRAAECLCWFMDDRGDLPRIGDDDEGRVLASAPEPDKHYVFSVAWLTARWLRHGLPLPGTPPPELRDLMLPEPSIGDSRGPLGDRTFDKGGYTCVRRSTAAGTSVFVMDHGPLGFLSIAAHGHADALSLTLNWGDEAVIVDPGTYLYHSGGAHRAQLRGTACHNTLQIEGENQSRIIGAFAWSEHAQTRVLARERTALTAVCDGWLRRFGVSHQRRFNWADANRFKLEDTLLGTPFTPLDWFSGLSAGPGCEVVVSGRTATIVTPGGRCVMISSALSDWSIRDAPYSPGFNRLQSVTRLETSGRIHVRQSAPVAAYTIELCG